MPGMRRREFVSLLGCSAAWPLAARAQIIPTVGFLSTASAASIAPFVEGFRRGLGAAGFVEGRNVAVEYRWADNQHDRLPTLAAELVAQRRYDKLAANYLAFIQLASIRLWLRVNEFTP